MRLIKSLVAIAFLAAGLLVGALNPQPVRLDLGFAILRMSLGVGLLSAVLLGVVAGGLVATAGVLLPMRRRAARDASTRLRPDA